MAAMIRNMRYRLALDIGTTSLGWCLLRLTPDNAPYAIIKMGVRIFPEGRVAKTDESLAVTRRTARLHRRRRDRLLKRKAAMERALINFGFWPSEDDARHALASLDPYALRAKGLDEVLTPAEFGRAVFHLNQRRGFKSNRKTDKADNDSGALKGAIKTLKSKLTDENCRTVGEWLAKRHTKREGTRARLRNGGTKDKAYDLYIDRSMIETEFDWLWRAQAAHNPTLYTAAAYDTLKDVLLFQRPLKPVKPGRCTLMPELERAPQALPSTQRFRVLQELNNLRPLNDDMTLAPLTLAQRNVLFETLERGGLKKKDGSRQSALSFNDMVKLLQLPRGTQFNLQDAKRDRLKGNATSVILQDASAFGEAWHSFSHTLQDEIVLQLLTQENEATLIAWLIAHTGVTEERASNLANTNLPEGYGSLSQVAVQRILAPLTADVITYDKAVLAAGFDSHSDLGAGRDGVVYDELPYYGQALERAVGFGSNDPNDPDDRRYGRIANPTVHIGLNQVRRVVNAIIKAYGHPSEVVLEVTRDLKISKQRQQDIQKEQKLNQDRNFYNVREGCKVLGLNPDNLDKAKRRAIAQKVQLWKELNWQDPINRFCPYTGERISIELLLSSQVEIEHILPYSRTFDDTLHNKTVAMVKANRDKGNQTPFEAFGQNQRANDTKYDYAAILERTRTMPANKRKRFAPDGYAQWLGKEGGDFMARALNDTAYLSKVAREYVQLICPGTNTVRAIPGRMTALIRGKFGLNELLSGDETKNRNDHRHHALDAAVIGITDTSMLQKFSRASASARDKHMDKLLDKLAYPWENYRQHVERGLDAITVSFKPDHSYEGAMHEDTAWGLLGDGKVTKRVVKEGDTTRSKTTATKAVIEINSTRVGSERARTRHGVDQNGVPLAYKGYVGGSNDCIEIWVNEKGKWEGEVISTWTAYQTVRELGQVEGYKKLRHPMLTQQGKQLVMRLMINDTVRMVVEGYVKTMRIAKIAAAGTITLSEHREANVASRDGNKDDPFSYVYKTGSSMQKALARKVTVNELGKVLDNGFQG